MAMGLGRCWDHPEDGDGVGVAVAVALGVGVVTTWVYRFWK